MGKKKSLCMLVSLASVLCFLFSIGQAQAQTDHKLIDKGFRIFTQETWNGNGRTCGTCHRPDEAYNIFPSTIKKLNKKERDLVFATNVLGLENINLVKSNALFNIEGGKAGDCRADDPQCWADAEAENPPRHPGPVFRSTMTIQALDLTTLKPPRPTFPGTLKLPAQCSAGLGPDDLPQLGWAGDGSPGSPVNLSQCHVHHGTIDNDADGSIRAFANGAIAQHSTLRLERKPGRDFRFATEEELDALEAFQKWLGRRPLTAEENLIQNTPNATEFDLALLIFKDPRVAKGRDHFLGVGQPNPNAPPGGPGGPPPVVQFAPNNGAGCDACHGNGGAKSAIAVPPPPPSNINLNTHVEEASVLIGQNVVGFQLPLDEGGAIPFVPRPNPAIDAFNIQSIIEAAEKKAWFHNHKVVDNFEKAIAHYGSDEFVNNAPVVSTLELLQNGNGITITFPQKNGINHLGAFLRALNAFYNLRDCERLIDEAIERIHLGISVENPVRHCLFNLNQLERVLRESKLPGLHVNVQLRAAAISLRLLAAEFTRNVSQFENIKASVRQIRDSIAVQTTEVQTPF
jgi:mono/diheme cytochrome c family protein